MNPDEPLLSSPNESSGPPHPPPKSFGSLGGCLCPTTSFSSSLEDTPKNIIEIEDDEVINNEKELDDSSLGTSTFYSADSQYLDQFPQECTPRHRRRKRMVSWGAPLEIQQGPPLSDSPRAPSRAHESANKSHRIRPKSMQFEEDPRLIYVDDPEKTNEKHEFTSNEVRTSKYTIINFLPKNLFLQFHRVAYLYFLAIAILNQLPPLAVFGRTVSLFPLLFVTLVTAIKDGYEDWRRHRSDQNENNRMALVHQLGKFELKKWKHIQPGEVVKICADEAIPCDIVLLGTSDPNGIAYIQTMNLDGESNLKTRYARQETTAMVLEGNIFSGIIRCEQPNRNIYEFTAIMEVNELRFPLSQSNIILRGCQLKNTDWVAGVVVYAGQETKALLNSAMTPSKRSRLETCMNRETLSLSAFLFTMCLVVSIGTCLWLLSRKDRLDTLPYYRKRYFGKGKKPGKTYRFYGIPLETFFSFLSSIIVFQIMIPISLYITMELVRLGQSFFMIGDVHMFDNSSNSRFQCRSLNINEDLGQIRYLFSDKTGTLTENKMEFRRASIRGGSYGRPMLMADGLHNTDIPAIQTEAPVINRRWILKSNIEVNSELMALLKGKVGGEQRSAAHDFFLTLATCNTVIPILTRSPSLSCLESELDEVVEAIDYQGESPDEQALVSAASAYGYTLFERTSGHVSIDVNGEELRLLVLGLHEFDSVRKRMSVVVRFPDNSVRVLVKGADTSMMSIINENSAEDEHYKHTTQSHLNEYSAEGLRTLVIAEKDLSDVELDEWQDMYEEAITSLTDRAMKLREAAALIECDLHLIGATAIEDKLQEGVPEVIESLREAGIKVWVLTGDKQETAISIGLSCKLLTSDMQQIIINGSSEKECLYLLTEAIAKYGVKSSNCKNLNVNLKKSEGSHQFEILDDKVSNLRRTQLGLEGDSYSESLALIIDGNSLVYILERDLENELFDLAISCRVVICCRVAPLQKAGIVDLIKSRTDDMTLAIGDGANDVSMIQMADVGVGICGQEGRQAVMASDFAMGQFRFLKRLLLVHGHWNYQRVGYLILYNFYRNAVFVVMLFWYILYTGYSATSALTEWSSMFYSLIYTSVPTIVVGILDKDLSDRTLLKYPKLYESGYRQESYNMYLFSGIMIDTLWQSIVLYYVPVLIYQESATDIWSIGSLWTIAVVILVNIHLAMDIQLWLVLTHSAVWGSIVITYACIVVLDSIPILPNYGTIYHLAKSPTYWLSILLIIVLALLPRFVLKLIHLTFWPSDIQIAREVEVFSKRHKFIGPRPFKVSG